jgi:starvation-inducible outer membrane lipoprotein
MKKLLIGCFVLLAGCGAHPNSFNSPQKQAINQQMQRDAVAQQQYQTGQQSNSNYFNSNNFNVLPNTLH